MSDIFELWDKDSSGVLTEDTLLLKAASAGRTGEVHSFPSGRILKTVFTYLEGVPDKSFIQEQKDLIYKSRLVCRTSEWEEYIKTLPVKFVLKRTLMAPLCAESQKELQPLPEGYSIAPFSEKVFSEHPFDHGRSYKDHEEFLRDGAGAVVLWEGKVVSSASSFISFEGHVELDVFTDPEHRGKGLADHAAAEMMRQCRDKGLTIHWDAQNVMSERMAEGHGFMKVTEYAVYWVEGSENE